MQPRKTSRLVFEYARRLAASAAEVLERLLPASARLPAPALGAQREHRRGRHARAAACRATSTGTSRLVFVFEYAHRLAASAAEILERLLLAARPIFQLPRSARSENIVAVDTLRQRPAALHRRGPRGSSSSSSTRIASRRAPPRSSSGCFRPVVAQCWHEQKIYPYPLPYHATRPPTPAHS